MVFDKIKQKEYKRGFNDGYKKGASVEGSKVIKCMDEMYKRGKIDALHELERDFKKHFEVVNSKDKNVERFYNLGRLHMAELLNDRIEMESKSK